MAHCRKFPRLVLVNNTLQLIIENWEKDPKQSSKTMVVYDFLASNWHIPGPEFRTAPGAEGNLGRRVGAPNIAITLG